MCSSGMAPPTTGHTWGVPPAQAVAAAARLPAQAVATWHAPPGDAMLVQSSRYGCCHGKGLQLACNVSFVSVLEYAQAVEEHSSLLCAYSAMSSLCMTDLVLCIAMHPLKLLQLSSTWLCRSVCPCCKTIRCICPTCSAAAGAASVLSGRAYWTR